MHAAIYNVSDSQTVAGVGALSAALSANPLNRIPSIYALCVKGTGAAASAWSAVLEGSLDGANWTTILTHISGTNADGATVQSAAQTANLGARAVYNYLRTRLVSVTLGSASAVVVSALGA